MAPRDGRRAVVFVDYDNARPNSRAAERNAADVQAGVLFIVEALVIALQARGQAYAELRLRFYGGWVHEDGRWSERAEWMREEMRSLRGLRNGVRILPEMAVAMSTLPSRDLRGTVRVRTDRSGYHLQQKMVDTMLTTDLVLMQLDPSEDPIVMSDDDDMIPAFMTSQTRHGRLKIFRRRAAGWSCNDRHLLDMGVIIETDWPSP